MASKESYDSLDIGRAGRLNPTSRRQPLTSNPLDPLDNNDNSTNQDHHDSGHLRVAVANYSPSDQRFTSSSIGSSTSQPVGATIGDNRPGDSRRRSSFRDYIAYALSFKAHNQRTRANYYYLISSLLCLNVFMSILNTILLSFVVKSLQLGGDHKLLFEGRLAWDAHLEGMVLDVPTSIVGGKSLSLTSIESHEHDRPLVLAALMGGSRQASESTQQLAAGSHSTAAQDERLLISTGQGPGHDDSSHILIGPDRQQQQQLDVPGGRARPAVEFVTDSLLVNQLISGKSSSPPAAAAALSSVRPPIDSFAASKPPEGRRQPGTAKTTTTTTATTTVLQQQQQTNKQPAVVRLLELDARRQSASLPLLERIELYGQQSSAHLMHVNSLLRCDAGISGALGANLDVQTRVGNLSCRSGGALTLVSRSGKLNVAPAGALLFEAPTLQLRAPATATATASSQRRLSISGLEFVNVEQAAAAAAASASAGDEQLRQLQKAASTATAGHPHAGPLRAYNLVLVDGTLMAASD